MTCPKCGRPIVDAIVCRFCIAAMNEEALRRRQHQPLLLVAAGQGKFTLHPTNTGLHVEMFGQKTAKTRRAFCGSIKRAAEKDQRREAYRGKAWPTACEKCREAIEELLADAREAEAIAAET